jgi:hypothetical protein
MLVRDILLSTIVDTFISYYTRGMSLSRVNYFFSRVHRHHFILRVTQSTESLMIMLVTDPSVHLDFTSTELEHRVWLYTPLS